MNTSQQVRIFIINLKKSPDRRSYMEKLLDGLGLKYEFVGAVYGKELDEADIARVRANASHFKRQWNREMTLGKNRHIPFSSPVYILHTDISRQIQHPTLQKV